MMKLAVKNREHESLHTF